MGPEAWDCSGSVAALWESRPALRAATASPCSRVVRCGEKALPSYKGTDPVMRAPPSWSRLTLITSQRPPLINLALEVRDSTYNLSGKDAIQFVACSQTR